MTLPSARAMRRAAQAPKRRHRTYSGRAFYLTLLVVSAITAFSFVVETSGSRSSSSILGSVQRRDLSTVHVEDQPCRLVRHAKDKCAFIQANCPDEEAGLLSYLTLYYCRLPHAKPVAFTLLALWLGLLFSTIGIAASDFFCVNLSTISNILGMSESMAGVTFLAFGNGSPDVFSTFAAMSTHSGSLAIGELIGAAGFITAVVAGSMALVREFKVYKRSFVRDVGFFIVAASFSMVFLYDGKLYLWECAVMVGFYVFYVFTVVIWHWWLGRRRRQRLREAAVRGHFIIPGNGEEENEQEYRDDEDEETDMRSRSAMSRGASIDDFLALERGGSTGYTDMEEDDDDENKDRLLGELNSNMRLSRPRMGQRRSTQNPIRPSLVGALEFRAVLSGLQKSTNIQSIPINLRRYSDGPDYALARQDDQLSSISESAAHLPYVVDAEDDDNFLSPSRPQQGSRTATGSRPRAVSANDADSLRIDPKVIRNDGVPKIDLLGPLPEEDGSNRSPVKHADSSNDESAIAPPSPSFSLSPPPSDAGARATSPARSRPRRPSPDLLAPPQSLFPDSKNQPLLSPNRTPADSAAVSPRTLPREYPKLTIPSDVRRRSPESSPFPPYRDRSPSAASSSRPPSIRLPPPSVSAETLYPDVDLEDGGTGKPLRWWPYKILPPPRVLFSTLFPTLVGWRSKNIWEKMLGLVAAPSVFLLTITLPVVEAPSSDDSGKQDIDRSLSLPGPLTPMENGRSQRKNTITIRGPETRSTARINGPINGQDHDGKVPSEHRSTAAAAVSAQNLHNQHHTQRPPPEILSPSIQPRMSYSPEQLPTSPPPTPPSSSKDWNRWLIILQAFTAPYFIVLVIWANAYDADARALLRPTLYSLLASLCALAFILATTTPTRPPRWRVCLCFLGFAVSIAWISTIAGEVVGVLKTLGVILDISDAILGLTIFAVGNSLGDLVADITVARLGYPVMALSACFGGPMLNILLGIGISGLYMTIRGAEDRHERHPGGKMQFKPYHIHVSSTLVISGASLLVTLVGLLVAVPMRGWRMDRWVGWGLVALWVLSTVGNLVVEISGWGSEFNLG